MEKYLIKLGKRKRDDEVVEEEIYNTASSTEIEDVETDSKMKKKANAGKGKLISTEKEENGVGDEGRKAVLGVGGDPFDDISLLITENSGWRQHLAPEFSKPYIKKLAQFLRKEYTEYKKVYPPTNLIFNAFNQCKYDDVRVVVIGQDPYHKPKQAFGLSFAVNVGVRPPPSLVNIYKELVTDVEGFERPKHGDLTHWAKQGVLLLNAVLTVREGQPTSHEKHGWEEFTQAVLKYISAQKKNVVFLCWGRKAEDKVKKSGVDGKKHLILTGPHPSPLAGNKFLGCKHFSKCNKYLKEHNLPEIDWHLPVEPDHAPYY